MAFTPPIFNVLCDIWFIGRVPSAGDPDFENQACQLYIPSRGILDITPGELELWVPPVYLRLPFSAIDIWKVAAVVECPPESGRYYRCRWKDIYHIGFPNQYLVAIVEQCNVDGVANLRDVEWAEGFDPGTGGDEGDLLMEVGIVVSGEGTSGGGGGDVTGDGAAETDITILVQGVGTTS
ncbi:MAG: hypothetical protein [Circular genetic element sp.]|nr:MAG: hypothetical protein [Circular genetic element sp.]